MIVIVIVIMLQLHFILVSKIIKRILMQGSNINLLLIVVLFCYKISAQNNLCVSNCQTLAHYDCRICYQSCPLTNNQPSGSVNASTNYIFQLKSCKVTYCAHWATRTYKSGNRTHTTTYCASYQQKDLDEQECVSKCCNKPDYTRFTN